MKYTKFEQFKSEWPSGGIFDTQVINHVVYDRDKYIKNLLDVGHVLDAKGIPFFLAFGTLLGAIRDQGPCAGDMDVDVMIKSEYEPQLIELVKEQSFFQALGFRICRMSTYYVSVDRANSYVDIYLMRPECEAVHFPIYYPADTLDDVNKIEDLDDKHYHCYCYRVLKWRLDNPEKIFLHGRTWNIPSQPETYLADKYGDWKTPANYHARS